MCEALCLTVVCVRVSVQWWLRGALAARGTAAVDAMRSVRISHVCVYMFICVHVGLCAMPGCAGGNRWLAADARSGLFCGCGLGDACVGIMRLALLALCGLHLRLRGRTFCGGGCGDGDGGRHLPHGSM